MNVILFPLYYCNLMLGVTLGFYHTSMPLDIKWRWRFWQYRNQIERVRSF